MKTVGPVVCEAAFLVCRAVLVGVQLHLLGSSQGLRVIRSGNQRSGYGGGYGGGRACTGEQIQNDAGKLGQAYADKQGLADAGE